MKNQSISDAVAAAMDAVLKSAEHKSLFGSKYGQDLNSAKDKCGKCHKDMESCMCDSSMADDQDAKKKKDDKDSSMAWDLNDARKKKEEKDSSKADDDENDARKKKEDKDSSDADDQDAKKKKEDTSDASDGSSEEKNSSAYFDVAIDSLLTASAALDSVGLGRGSALSLKLASLVVEAKKKDKDSKKSKKDSKDSKKDSNSAKDKKDPKKDSHSAKDKKSDSSSKKSDSKKDDKKSSKK